MANTITPNMSLVVPTVGSEAGPTYANDINASLTTIDQHSHVTGSGVPITPAALNINSALSMNNQLLTNVQAVTLYAQGSDASAGSLYEKGVDLYYRDGNGNVVRITQSGSVTGSSGTITGLPSGTASASYGAGKFTFQSATSTSATIDGGSIILRNNVANSKGLTLNPPNAMAADMSFSFPPDSGTNDYVLKTDGAGATSWRKWAAPTMQVFTATGSSTYTLPSGVKYIRVRCVGSGAGGHGGGLTTPNGSDGNASTFGSTLLVAGGGSSVTSQGGTGSISAPAQGFAISGGMGGAGGYNVSGTAPTGGQGGGSYFGSGGQGGSNSGGAGATTRGAGGGGGSGTTAANTLGGAGGGSGAYCEAIIGSPSASYAVFVGTGGAGGSAGVSGYTGANGSDGIVIVDEYYF